MPIDPQSYTINPVKVANPLEVATNVAQLRNLAVQGQEHQIELAQKQKAFQDDMVTRQAARSSTIQDPNTGMPVLDRQAYLSKIGSYDPLLMQKVGMGLKAQDAAKFKEDQELKRDLVHSVFDQNSHDEMMAKLQQLDPNAARAARAGLGDIYNSDPNSPYQQTLKRMQFGTLDSAKQADIAHQQAELNEKMAGHNIEQQRANTEKASQQVAAQAQQVAAQREQREAQAQPRQIAVQEKAEATKELEAKIKAKEAGYHLPGEPSTTIPVAEKGKLIEQDPAQFVQDNVPKDMRLPVYKEIERNQKTVNIAPKIMQAMDQVNNELKDKRYQAMNLAGADTPGQKKLQQLMNSQIVNLTDTARQAEFESASHNLVPRYTVGATISGMDNVTKNMKETMGQFLTSHLEAPVSKGNKIDLSQFKSTSLPDDFGKEKAIGERHEDAVAWAKKIQMSPKSSKDDQAVANEILKRNAPTTAGR